MARTIHSDTILPVTRILTSFYQGFFRQLSFGGMMRVNEREDGTEHIVFSKTIIMQSTLATVSLDPFQSMKAEHP